MRGKSFARIAASGLSASLPPAQVDNRGTIIGNVLGSNGSTTLGNFFGLLDQALMMLNSVSMRKNMAVPGQESTGLVKAPVYRVWTLELGRF